MEGTHLEVINEIDSQIDLDFPDWAGSNLSQIIFTTSADEYLRTNSFTGVSP